MSEPAGPERSLAAPIPLTTTAEGARLSVQVQGLLMEVGELSRQLDEKERELEQLRAQVAQKDSELQKAHSDRASAERALARLTMQLASRR